MSDSSFVGLDVEAHHYKNIEGLVLNNNKLATLGNNNIEGLVLNNNKLSTLGNNNIEGPFSTTTNCQL